MQTGYELMQAHQITKACDHWLDAWKQIKDLATPTMRTVEAFDDAYPGLLQSVFNWSQDLEMELHNAGFSNPVYFEHRIRCAREYLAQFPDDDDGRHIAFRRAESKAFWRLGRTTESEAVYQDLIETLPDKAWGYIGWSDQYYFWRDAPADYKRAEAILRQALARPNLDDRRSAQERLKSLFKQQQNAEQVTTSATGKNQRNQSANSERVGIDEEKSSAVDDTLACASSRSSN